MSCPFGNCSHGEEQHKDGSCFEVTEPEKMGTEIYCKCDVQGGQNLRLYSRIGMMFPQAMDMMVTKKCIKCRVEGMLRVDETLCSVCRPYDQPKQDEISHHIIFRPVSQQELQRVF